MQNENICTTCGHDKWSHAISLKGEVGWCMKTLIEGWSYCDCKKFTPPNKACSRLVEGGGNLPAKKSNRKGSAPAKSGLTQTVRRLPMRDLTKENYIHCKYCGAKLKRDHIGKYCGTRNCQWEFGVRYPGEGLLTPNIKARGDAAAQHRVQRTAKRAGKK